MHQCLSIREQDQQEGMCQLEVRENGRRGGGFAPSVPQDPLPIQLHLPPASLVIIPPPHLMLLPPFTKYVLPSLGFKSSCPDSQIEANLIYVVWGLLNCSSLLSCVSAGALGGYGIILAILLSQFPQRNVHVFRGNLGKKMVKIIF